MDHLNFSSFLNANIEKTDLYLKPLLEHCKEQSFSKGEFLLQPGEYCKHSFYVEKGLLRQYSLDANGKEHIIQFAPENWFVSERDSVFFDNPASYYIQAIEVSRVLLFEEKFIIELSQKNEAFNEQNNRMLHKHIKSLQKRINMLLGATAEERYLDFIKTYPDVLLRVPQTMVAAYLGITPESLSRVRKSLAKKNT
ncbi:Crp/Fnr family transcriptional regulator [Christiangramia salexigens]|uniref:Cyclic nucleotide-binding protein n=1 Tax=Christiangramia salexigens TaxID=1913577 RepID=A0A1L3J473_9FLAO|nr:Crp/Fnr family transcriptional regulator [Christiangramia salexigens]APG59910.1 cyclic nucleotide-binding protein [Christiangramia salexigens]